MTGGAGDVQDAVEPDGTADGRHWLAALPDQLDRHRQLLSRLVELCRREPRAASLSVGCSLGRGAADRLSDVDAALGVTAGTEKAGVDAVAAVEQVVIDALPDHGPLVDVLRQRVGPPDRAIRRVFAQFVDGLQLDLAVLPETDVRRGRAAPDFVALYRRDTPPPTGHPEAPPQQTFPPADRATAEQIHDWTFLAWIALADAGKYLRRGSAWEAHHRLNEARDHIWALWAAATGATYPWHGLSQVLDHDPHRLPPGIEATVTGLDLTDLCRGARISAEILIQVSELAAATRAAHLPVDLAGHVTADLSTISVT